MLIAKNIMSGYVITCQKNLSIFPDQPYKHALDAMADFVVQRNY